MIVGQKYGENESINISGEIYRIAIQALPGSKITINGMSNSEKTLEVIEDGEFLMGPTGLYELGFEEPIITSVSIEPLQTDYCLVICDYAAESIDEE